MTRERHGSLRIIRTRECLHELRQLRVRGARVERSGLKRDVNPLSLNSLSESADHPSVFSWDAQYILAAIIMELLYVSLRDDAKLNMPLVQNFLALAHPPSETVAR